MMLNGLELDKCNRIEGLDHWVKASQSHMHAVTHAKSIGANIALVMEQDSTADPKAGGVLRTSTRPTTNLHLLLLRASV